MSIMNMTCVTTVATFLSLTSEPIDTRAAPQAVLLCFIYVHSARVWNLLGERWSARLVGGIMVVVVFIVVLLTLDVASRLSAAAGLAMGNDIVPPATNRGPMVRFYIVQTVVRMQPFGVPPVARQMKSAAVSVRNVFGAFRAGVKIATDSSIAQEFYNRNLGTRSAHVQLLRVTRFF